jgi:rifampicin phosphotransferase
MAGAFLSQWDALMKRFGYTTTTHLMDLPTWREDPGIPLGMIAAMAHEPLDRNPRLAEIRAAQQRMELEAALESLDAGSDPELSLLRRVHRVARHLAPASEDHNLLCDQQLIAAARVKWLSIGTHLVARGLLASEHDVFYLTVDELLGALEAGAATSGEVISQRRAEQARWRSVTPPARLGVASTDTAHTSTDEHSTSDDAAPTEVRGVAASAGTYRGRARVVAGLPDAHRLQPGDVLVCAATSPEWTPYFGVVGALVAGTGSLLAHAAVVAREFGIPAVVGAAGAPALIPDGAIVTVDGSRGIVTVEPRVEALPGYP